MSRLTDAIAKEHVYSWTTGTCSCGEKVPSNYHYSYHLAETTEQWVVLLATSEKFAIVEDVLRDVVRTDPFLG